MEHVDGTVNINEPVSNPRVKELLIRKNSISDGNSGEMEKCINELLDEIAFRAHMLTVIEMPDENIQKNDDGTAIISKDTKVSFEGIDDVNDNHYLVAYTDWESLRKCPFHQNDDVKTMVLSFDDYFAMLKDGDSGLSINPFSDNFVITKTMLQHIKKVKEMKQAGHYDKVIQKDTSVMIGDPADVPSKMKKAIAKAAKSDKRIKAIYLKQMINGNEKSYLLVVDFKGEKNEIFPVLAKAGQPYLPKEMFLDIVPLDSDLGKKAANNKPFYKRGFSLKR